MAGANRCAAHELILKELAASVNPFTQEKTHDGLLISIYPFIKAWLNINHILPSFGNFRVHPTPANPAPDQPIETIRREGTQSQLNLERSKSRMGTFVEGGPMAETNPEEGTSSDMPDVLSRRKLKQTPSDQDLP
ncbi:kinocilin isoform X2 [Sparus aurata]|uniref:kinocilin isoform X2 n=1 Tax=Sparus aurata TaxID=8175 RepID=UPI0011C16A3C|nr:kinocilin isoform X2 [Sparus aurata]